VTNQELNQQIKLIFAQACANALQATADAILSIDSDKDRQQVAEAHGRAFASAFAYVAREFISEEPAPFGEQLEGRKSLSSSTSEVAAQQPEAHQPRDSDLPQSSEEDLSGNSPRQSGH
jgi:hypothetical protein